MASVYPTKIHIQTIPEIVQKHNMLVDLLGKDLSGAVGSGGVVAGAGKQGSTGGNVVLWDDDSGRKLRDSSISGAWFNQSVTTDAYVDFAGVWADDDIGTTMLYLVADDDYKQRVYNIFNLDSDYTYTAKATDDDYYTEYARDLYEWDDEAGESLLRLVRKVDLTTGASLIPLLTVNELTLQAVVDGEPVLVMKSEDGKIEHTTTITNAGAMTETVATDGGTPVMVRSVNTATGASTIPTATMSKLYIGTYTLPDDLDSMGNGGSGGTGYPTQTMTEMTDMTVDDEWRDWEPEDVSFTNNAVYQVWLSVADGTDKVVATGSFLWSDLPSMIECSCEVPLHQLAYYAQDGMNIYMRTYCDGVNEMTLQLASTSELTSPVINAKFVRML